MSHPCSLFYMTMFFFLSQSWKVCACAIWIKLFLCHIIMQQWFWNSVLHYTFSLEVGSFLFNFLHSQDLKATLHQSVNISTGRLQASSRCVLNIAIENIQTAHVPLMWSKRDRGAALQAPDLPGGKLFSVWRLESSLQGYLRRTVHKPKVGWLLGKKMRYISG